MVYLRVTARLTAVTPTPCTTGSGNCVRGEILMGGAFGRSGLLAAASGDAAAGDRIVDDHVEAVWGTARASGLEAPDAVEVCQLVWLRLAQTLATLGETPDVRAWLHDATVTEA